MVTGRLLNKWCLLAVLAVALLSACTKRTPLYNWGPYQPISYQLMQHDSVSVQDQIHSMEEHSQQTDSKGARLPPGYHAQLGLLYALAGNMERMQAEFLREKELFPEAATYMDFLLSEKNKPEKKREK